MTLNEGNLKNVVHPGRIEKLPEKMRNEYYEYIRFLCSRGLSARSINTRYATIISRFFLWCHEDHDLDSIKGVGAVKVIEHLAWLNSEGVSQNVIGMSRYTIKRLLEWQFINGWLGSDDIIKVDISKALVGPRTEKPPPRSLTKQEVVDAFRRIEDRWPYDPEAVERYMRGVKMGAGPSVQRLRRSLTNVQMQAAVMLALETGMRIQEMWQLEVETLDPIQDSLTFKGKFGKWRTVPYPERLKPMIKSWLSHRELVIEGLPEEKRHNKVWVSIFRYPWGLPISYNGMTTWPYYFFGRQRQNNLGDPKSSVDAGWHILRKTFATERWRAGMPIDVLSRILGHSNMLVTEVYLGVKEGEAIERAKLYEQEVSEHFQSLREEGIEQGKMLNRIKERIREDEDRHDDPVLDHAEPVEDQADAGERWHYPGQMSQGA